MAVVDDAVAALRAGELVVLPTDTVYGLAGWAGSAEAASRIARLKGRPGSMPIALVAASLDALLACLPELPERARVVARALLPGPYTLILPNPGRRYPWLAAARPETIGVRVPELPDAAREVVEAVGAVAATSANLHGGRDPRRLEDIPRELREACGAVLEGGELPGIASTVLDFTAAEPVVVREGAAPAAEALAHALAAAG